ncbi:class F sortase [Cutibacterium equinum]|uniref:class F sortase n=1 Tax=Cutibacterium equinum TaxID=3016342 RepID=UPI0038CDAE1B
MRNVTVLVLCVVTVLAGAGLIWCGVTATPTPDGWSRDREGALVIPAPHVGHDPHPSPVGPVAQSAPGQSGSRVIIPAVGIDARIAGRLSQRDDGGWYPPAHGVAWAAGSAPLSAASGTTTLAGHVWSTGEPGVFFRLREVRVGHEIAVTDEGRHLSRYRVTDITVTPKAMLPPSAWGTRSGPRRLILVTCGGRETGRAGHRSWDSNVIVVAEHVKDV